MELKVCFLGAVRRRTFICCRNVRISASSAARDRNRSATIQTMSLTRSPISQQHRPILDQLLVRLSLRQGQAEDDGGRASNSRRDSFERLPIQDAIAAPGPTPSRSRGHLRPNDLAAIDRLSRLRAHRWQYMPARRRQPTHMISGKSAYQRQVGRARSALVWMKRKGPWAGFFCGSAARIPILQG
jgi:hypothetical protein